jgi:pilus assembly protein Flp/PilA
MEVTEYYSKGDIVMTKDIFARFRQDISGATALEYGLLAALIAVVIIAAVTTLGENVKTTFEEVGNAVKSANDANP